MRGRFLRTGFGLLGTLAVVSCGASPVAPASASSSAHSTVVSVNLPLGHTTTLVPGERVPVSATLTAADGRTSDCTATATWTVSDERVATFSSTPGELVAVAGGSVSVFAACSGVRSAPLILGVGGGVKIIGLEPYAFLLPTAPGLGGTTVHLTARTIDANGALGEDCTRTGVWRTDDPSVATVDHDYSHDSPSPDPSYLTARQTGITVVSVTCGGAVGQAVVTVRALLLRGVVRDTSGQPVAGADVALGANVPGQPHFTTAADGSYSGETSINYLCIQASAEDTSIARPACVLWDLRQSTITIDATVARLFSAVLREGNAVTCQADVDDPRCPVTGPNGTSGPFYTYFHAPADGTVVIHVTWSTGGLFGAYVSCNRVQVAHGEGQSGSLGFQLDAVKSCQYLITFTHQTGAAVTPFNYRILQ